MAVRTQSEIDLEAALVKVRDLEQEVDSLKSVLRVAGFGEVTPEVATLASSMYNLWRSKLSPEQRIDNHDWLYAGTIRRRAYMDLAASSMRYRTLCPEVKDVWRLFQDGDQWCALLGENLQSGISGFGDTQSEAISAFKAGLDHAITQIEGMRNEATP